MAREQAEINARLARLAAEETRAAEQRRRRVKARTLARALAAELCAGADNLRLNVGVVVKGGEEGLSFDLHGWASLLLAPIDLFETQLANIGLLGELAGPTVAVYDTLRRVRRFDEIQRQGIEATGELIVAATVAPEDRWGQYATLAAEVAAKLEAYEPPDDI